MAAMTPGQTASHPLETLLALMQEQRLDAVAVTDLFDIRYLCGFTGSNGLLLVMEAGSYFITDSRYALQATAQVSAAATVIAADLDAKCAELISARCAGYVGVETATMSAKRFERFKRLLAGAQPVALDGMATRLRMCKTPSELARLRAASALAEEALLAVLPGIRPGITEAQIARDFHLQAIGLGAQGLSFDTIVAGGPRAALPHATPGSRPFAPGELVVVDFGVILDGYCSDQTVTIPVGEVDAETVTVYNTVLKAQRAALAAIKPGVLLRDIDRAARSVIDEAGYAEYFGHGTGHGVGLEVHEAPAVSFRTNDFAQEAMVITIEPGIYLPGKLGVRLEDTVWIGAEGYEAITTLPKELGAVAALLQTD
jgi:Xaa-Pro aminopeptidase